MSRTNAAGRDLIITNANVFTADQERARAEAVAVLGDRLVAVGSAKDIDVWPGKKTRVIDAQGRSLLPGFNDAHLHITSGGASLDRVQLRDTSTPEELRQRIAERAAKTPKGEWVLGGDWDHENFTPAEPPTRELLDPVTKDTPVWVNRLDGHMALANSLALKLAGITRETPDPPGGTIVHDRAGEPTGCLKDAAMNLVEAVVPPMTREQRTRALKRAMEHTARLGVTSVQDMGSEDADISVMAELAEKGELTVRVNATMSVARVEDELADMVLLSEDVFSIPEARLKDVKAVATWVGGRLVYGQP